MEFGECLPSESLKYHHPLFHEFDLEGDDAEKDTIHVLNDDCLEMIISYLTIVQKIKISLVCRRWYNMCMLNVSRTNFLSVRHLSETAKYSYRMCRYLAVDSLLSVLSLSCRNLSSLSLDSQWINGLNNENLSAFSQILLNCKELTVRSNFQKCLNNHNATQDLITEHFGSNLETLTYELGHDDILRRLLKNTQRLTHLRLMKFSYYSNTEDGRQCDGSCISEVLSGKNPLVSVKLDCVMLNLNVVDYILREFSKTLKTFSVSKDVAERIYIRTPLPQLKRMSKFIACIDEINLSPGLRVHFTQQLLSITEVMPNLRVLVITGHSYVGIGGSNLIELLSCKCPLLEELRLSNCGIPAIKLECLRFEFLKRLFLDNFFVVNGFDKSCRNYFFEHFKTYDFAASIQCIAKKVLPHLKLLECFSISDNHHVFQEEDIALLISRARSNFKNLTLSIPHTLSKKSQRKFIEKLLKKCNRIARNESTTITIEGFPFPHGQSCTRTDEYDDNFDSNDDYEESCPCYDDIRSYFQEISPSFLRIVVKPTFCSSKFNEFSLTGSKLAALQSWEID